MANWHQCLHLRHLRFIWEIAYLKLVALHLFVQVCSSWSIMFCLVSLDFGRINNSWNLKVICLVCCVLRPITFYHVGFSGLTNIKCHEKFKSCIKKVQKSGKAGFSEECPYSTAVPIMVQGMDLAIVFSQLGNSKLELWIQSKQDGKTSQHHWFWFINWNKIWSSFLPSLATIWTIYILRYSVAFLD